MKQVTEIIVWDYDAKLPLIPPSAETLKSAALEATAMIAVVNSGASQQAAVLGLADIDALIRAIEKQRIDQTKPFLEAQRQLKACADDFAADLKAESLRLKNLICKFQEDELARAQEAERLRQKADQELEEARQRADEEAKRVRAEADAKTQQIADEAIKAGNSGVVATNAVEQIVAIQQEAAAAVDALTKSIEEKREQVQESLSLMPVAPRVAAGQKVDEDYEITVTDFVALAQSGLQFVTITPKIGAIKDAIRAGQPPNGIQFKKIVKVSARRTAATDFRV